MIFTDYWNVLVLNFSGKEITVFFWGKKLIERWFNVKENYAKSYLKERFQFKWKCWILDIASLSIYYSGVNFFLHNNNFKLEG